MQLRARLANKITKDRRINPEGFISSLGSSQAVSSVSLCSVYALTFRLAALVRKKPAPAPKASTPNIDAGSGTGVNRTARVV